MRKELSLGCRDVALRMQCFRPGSQGSGCREEITYQEKAVKTPGQQAAPAADSVCLQERK